MDFDLLYKYPRVTPFSHHPDFSLQGYQVITELGRNQEGGRITYLAQNLNSKIQVVIKEFCRTSISVDWSGVKAYEREISILQKLNHPRIPRYLDFFETPSKFYLVQEYKNAPSLGLKRHFQPEEIKQIALSVLEILVYLQEHVSPIIHRDIKPENILVDEQLNAYLVDFGLAQLADAKTDLTMLVAGTPGFIPPEEHLGKPLTKASDLYSLGATLICLLTHTRSGDISKLIDENHRFNLQKLSPQISPQFRSWLRKMTNCKSSRRYSNAFAALQALKSMQIIGGSTKINNLWTKFKKLKIITILGMGMIGTLFMLGMNLMLYQVSDLIQFKEIHNYQIQD